MAKPKIQIRHVYIAATYIPPMHIHWYVNKPIEITPEPCDTESLIESCALRGGACAYTKVTINN